jgi:flagellar protein FliL
MIRKILPILLALIGLGGGVGAGLALKPAADHAAEGETPVEAAPAEAGHEAASAEPGHEAAPPEGEHAAEPAPAPGTQAVPETPEGETPLHDYVKLNNQFVVPVVMDGQVASMVILALSLEVTVGGTEQVYALEPKLRDVFLQVLFDHANSGGFSGEFTESKNMVVLRDALREAAIKVLGASLTDVLIIDIARQDL